MRNVCIAFITVTAAGAAAMTKKGEKMTGIGRKTVLAWTSGIMALLTIAGCTDTVPKTIPTNASAQAAYYIDASRCKICGECFMLCPEKAIIETKIGNRWVYCIDPAVCTGCGECIKVCRFGGIARPK